MYRRVFDWMSRHEEGYVSINVSPRHFHAETFAERLLRMVDDAGADPRRLRMEITEVALLEDAPRILRMLNWLRERGGRALLASSEERSGGKEGVRTGRSGVLAVAKKKK